MLLIKKNNNHNMKKYFEVKCSESRKILLVQNNNYASRSIQVSLSHLIWHSFEGKISRETNVPLW